MPGGTILRFTALSFFLGTGSTSLLLFVRKDGIELFAGYVRNSTPSSNKKKVVLPRFPAF